MAESQRRMPNGYVDKGDYDSYVPDDSYQASPNHFGSGPKAYNVRVLVNNDPYEPGKKILVERGIRDIDSFLERCGQKLNPRFGCARNIHTARGTKRVRYIDELTENGVYVISGKEAFNNKINYRDIPENRRLPSKKKGQGKIDKLFNVTPVTHPTDERLHQIRAKWDEQSRMVKGIRLRVNVLSKNEDPPKTVCIPYKIKDDIIRVTDEISYRLGIKAIMRIYEIVNQGGPLENFKPIWQRNLSERLDSNRDGRPVELQNDQHILVVPLGSTKKLDSCIYSLHGKPNFKTSKFASDPFSLPTTPYKHNQSLYKYSKVPGIGSNTMSPASNQSGSYGVRSNRNKRQRPAKQVDYDRDDGGVYRSKQSDRYSKNARQVNDTKETRTERHIDDREAETVEEEDIHHNEKTTPIPPGTELNKQPSKEQKQNADTGIQTKNKEVKKGKNMRDAQKVSVKDEVKPDADEAKKDSKVNPDGKTDIEALEKPPKQSDGQNDRNLEQTPNQLIQENVEPNRPPMSTTPPKHLSETPDIKQSQEHVDRDGGYNQRIDEYDDDPHDNSYGRNQSQSKQNDSRASNANDNSYDRNESPLKQPTPRASTPPSRREARRKQQQQENEAASNIQAHFRGYQTRRDFNRKKQQGRQATDDVKQQQPNDYRQDDDDDRRKKDEAASKIQATFKGYKTRQSVKEKKVRDHKKIERENIAAAKIQGHYRGYKVRKEYAGKRGQNVEVVKDVNDNEKKDEHNDREMRDRAASKIQSRYKGYKTRKQYMASKAKKSVENEQSIDTKSYAEREKAASKIQAGFRGHQVRQKYVSKKADRNNIDKQAEETRREKENEAASKIQANFKGFKERRRYQDRKRENTEKEQAASRIQASFNGYKTRKDVSEKKKAQLPDQSNPADGKSGDLDKAASTIQSRYRGYRVRKQYNTKVILESEVESDVDQLPDSALTRQHVKKNQITLGTKEHNATKIQICFRAHHFRKLFFDDCNESDIDQNNDIDNDEGVFKNFFASKLAMEEEVTKPEQYSLLQTNAATTIQANYRGYKVRQTKFYPLRQVNKIQAAFRGHVTRKVNNISNVKNVLRSVEGANYYASLIQSLCRGYITRKSLNQNARPVKSALSIQGPTKSNDEISFWADSNIKMYSDRSLRQAATRIQAAYFSFIVRNGYVLIREKIMGKQTKAAVNIQAWFRGCQTRKKLSEKGLENSKTDQSKEECEKDIESYNNMIVKMEESKDQKENTNKKHDHKNAISRMSSGRKISAKSVHRSRTHTPEKVKGNGATIENESLTSRPSTGESRKSYESLNVQDRSRSRPSSAIKRDHSGKLKSVCKKHDTEIKIHDTGEIHAVEKEDTKDSFETMRTLKTLKSSKISEKSSRCEVEKEGESPREIEDDASELSKMRKNALAVSQIQAAFKAYRLRREVSELLSGGGELMDIKSVDRAVSALKKDFKLRSAKVRRLGSYQFLRRPKVSDWWDADNEEDFVKSISADTVQAAFRSFHGRKTWCTFGKSVYNKEQSVKLAEQIIEPKPKYEQAGLSEEKQTAASNKLQAGFKGFLARERHQELKEKGNVEPTEIKDAIVVSESEQIDQNSKVADSIKKDKRPCANSINATFKGFVARKYEQNERLKKKSALKIVAAYQSYLTRKKYTRARQEKNDLSRIKSGSSRMSFHVKMHSMAISNRATYLQAAFAAYQTRKVFISLTKIVEQDSSADTSNCNLERMGSLSETDDFKLRHKSIIKIQTLEAERRELHKQTSKTKGSSIREKDSGYLSLVNRKHLPLNSTQNHVTDIRPKSGLCLNRRNIQTIDIKSKTQPELKRGPARAKANEKLHGIEIFMKKKIAATVIQSCAKGFIVRQTYICKIADKTAPRTHAAPSSRNSSRPKEEKNSPDWVKNEIRARTASIKLEAEKRKLIAKKVQQKKAKDAVENVLVLSMDVKDLDQNNGASKQMQNNELPPILSERLLAHEDEREKETASAIKIQKVYRGYTVRKNVKAQLKNTAELENEYEAWKTKRIEAAVSIQSIWRGYTVRRELQKEHEEQANMIQDDGWNCDSPPGMLIINIGRTKSEIERANQKYERCCLIQMVVRASKVRRNMKVKMAKRRGKKMNSANIIHASVKGYFLRKENKCRKCAAHIQSLAKGFLSREHLQERIKMRQEAQQMAATTLQSVYKGCMKRKDNEAQKEVRRKLAEAQQSALVIQSAFRGHIVRDELDKTKLIMQKEAAIKIQAGVASYKERVKMKERKVAASKLTAACRSYLRRRDLRLYKEKMERERIASTRLQSAFRAYCRRVARRLYTEKLERERFAASRIQSGYKSYLARCEMRACKELKARKEKAVSIIQSAANGCLARIKYQLLKQLHQREQATLKIQSMYRGYRERLSVKKLKHMIEVNDAAKDIVELLFDNAFGYIQQRQESAERIQATVKGFSTRSKQSIDRQVRLSQRNECATTIQAVVRAEQGRIWNEKLREITIKNAAATKIQCVYRGHYTRKQIDKEKSMIAEIEPPFMSARTRSGRLLALSLDEVLMKNARAMILFHKKAGELQAAFRAYRQRQNTRDRFFIKQQIIDLTPRREKSIKLASYEDRAAVAIQKTWRGYSDRKAYKRLISIKRKSWHSAACIIHAAVIGYERRKSARRKKERMMSEGSELIRSKRREAADIISYAFRALQKRNEKVAIRVEM